MREKSSLKEIMLLYIYISGQLSWNSLTARGQRSGHISTRSDLHMPPKSDFGTDVSAPWLWQRLA